MRLRRAVTRVGAKLLNSSLLHAAALVGVAVVVAFALPPEHADQRKGPASTLSAASEQRSDAPRIAPAA